MKTDFKYLEIAAEEMYKVGAMNAGFSSVLILWAVKAQALKDTDYLEEDRRHDEIINEIEGTPC